MDINGKVEYAIGSKKKFNRSILIVVIAWDFLFSGWLSVSKVEKPWALGQQSDEFKGYLMCCNTNNCSQTAVNNVLLFLCLKVFNQHSFLWRQCPCFVGLGTCSNLRIIIYLKASSSCIPIQFTRNLVDSVSGYSSGVWKWVLLQNWIQVTSGKGNFNVPLKCAIWTRMVLLSAVTSRE